MLKIGLIGGMLGEQVYEEPYRKWMDSVSERYYNKETGEYLFEPALAAAIEDKFSNVQVTYIPKFDEKKIKEQDVNFLAGRNLLNAWDTSTKEYNRVLKIMKDKKNNIYPPLKEQNFLYNKGDYLKYYEKKGIPIAPTFLVKKDRNVKRILNQVKRKGWESFVMKAYYAYANYSVKRFDMNDKHIEKKLQKYFDKNKKYPAFICQEVMIGFASKWEVKSFWINGEFKYYIATKACEQVFDEQEIYKKCSSDIGSVSPKILKLIKSMGKKVIDHYPSSSKPLFLRIDFGCCLGSKPGGSLSVSNYFLNEIEYAGCGLFLEIKNTLHHWRDGYYKKAIELTK